MLRIRISHLYKLSVNTRNTCHTFHLLSVWAEKGGQVLQERSDKVRAGSARLVST